jgi:hypothetical protein
MGICSPLLWDICFYLLISFISFLGLGCYLILQCWDKSDNSFNKRVYSILILDGAVEQGLATFLKRFL